MRPIYARAAKTAQSTDIEDRIRHLVHRLLVRIYVVEGKGEFDLGCETVQVNSGSFIRMEALLPHAVRAKSPFRNPAPRVIGGEPET